LEKADILLVDHNRNPFICSTSPQEIYLPRAKSRSGFFVRRTRRGENVEHGGTLRTTLEAVRHAARCAPEVAGFDQHLPAILRTNATAFQQIAPLLFRVAVCAAAGVRLDGDDRQHGLITDEDARG